MSPEEVFRLINQPAALVVTLAICFIVFAIEQGVLQHFRHKNKRREYQYERSATITRSRFKEEFDHTRALAELMFRLCLQTEAIKEATNQDKEQVNQVRISFDLFPAWKSIYDEAVKVLGGAAPFISFQDLKSGAANCGVRNASPCASDDLSCKSEKDCSQKANHTQSLFMHASVCIDRCAESVDRCLKEVKSPIDFERFDICGLMDYSKDSFGSYAQEYNQYLSCAYCRVRNRETGEEDGRRIRRKGKILTLKKWLFPAYYKWLEPSCMMWQGKTSTLGEKVKTVFFVSVFIALIVGVIFLFGAFVIPFISDSVSAFLQGLSNQPTDASNG